jgi:hypothetical protein
MAMLRTFTRRLFIILNSLAVLLFFLLACANSFLHPGRWWLISMLGLFFPYLLLLVIVLFLVISAVRPPGFRRWSLLSFVSLADRLDEYPQFRGPPPGQPFRL